MPTVVFRYLQGKDAARRHRKHRTGSENGISQRTGQPEASGSLQRAWARGRTDLGIPGKTPPLPRHWGRALEQPKGFSRAAQGPSRLSECGMCGRPSPPSVQSCGSAAGPASRSESHRRHRLQRHLLPSLKGPCELCPLPPQQSW